MEKSCEFCKLLRPVVYCKSDAAHLCLTCDAKVHSANALSYRHPRTLVCESCRHHPSLVRCFDHEMFMCQSCDAGHHASLEHRRKVVSCYLGCPSAKDLAELWGFDFKELENKCAEFEGRSSTRGTKLVNDENSHKSSYLILQQILELERLQLSEGVDSCLLHVKERADGSQFRHDTTWREHKILDKQVEHLDDHLDFQQKDNALDDEKSEEPLTSPFPQLENPLNGESFWQYKSPLRNNEFWLQNMQDLGVCDEVQCFDDVEIPDVDLTFRNFEEVFGTEQEQSRALQAEDTSMACSFTDKHGKLDKECTSTIEVCNDVDKQPDTLEGVVLHHHPMSPYSASSFSVSRITGESSGSEYKDDGVSPTHPGLRLDSGSSKLDSEENALTKYKEKKFLSCKNRCMTLKYKINRQEKQGHYTSPRSKSGFKKRSKIQVSRAERVEIDSPNATQSF